jgi:hypothetical protein
MRLKRWSFLVAVLSAITVLGIGFTTAPKALAQSFPDNVCTPGPGQCLNLWDNDQNTGAPVKWYHYRNSGGYNNWDVQVVGTVVGDNCESDCYPFALGSELNSRYNGDDVLRFAYWNNTYYIADQSDYSTAIKEGNLEIAPEDGSKYQLFVWSGEGYLIAVGASNAQFAYDGTPNVPVWLGGTGGNTGNGAQVTMSNEQSWSKPFILVSSGG